MGCQVIAMGLVLGGLGGGMRSVVMGEGDYLYAEAGRMHGAGLLPKARSTVAEAMAFLGIPKNAIVMTYPAGIWHTLRYEAHRPIALVGDSQSRSEGSVRAMVFVLTPEVGPIWHRRPKDYVWFAEKARLVAQFGRYSFYELPDGLPEDFDQISTSYPGHPGSQHWFGRGQMVARVRCERTSRANNSAAWVV